jgi:phospholipase D1/2
MSQIVEPHRNAWRIHPATQFGLLVDADDYYRAFYQAALQAERVLMLSGWQFDSDVELLRGPEAEQATAPVQLLKFLNHLCEVKPDLQIWILAWDFHIVFAIEREWMQRLVFDWKTNPRLHFRFDANHVENGSHHQKFVVVDDAVTFLGGLDLCNHRWDNHDHKNVNPLRLSRGEPHRPFHDVQAYLESPEIARSLRELFLQRWEHAGGDPIDLKVVGSGDSRVRLTSTSVPGLVPIASSSVALSRTDPYGTPDGPPRCTEIRTLYIDAIEAAEQLIYIETQYFSSHVMGEVLERRMRDASKPLLEIVLVINMKGETLKEQAAVGLAQAELVGRMRVIAAETGHHLGIYYTNPACGPDDQPQHTTYIHSKLMVVDDRFLTVGSANLTNRSMAVDTELNASVETRDASDELARSIRTARALLLGEHTGGPPIEQSSGLVSALDQLAAGTDPAAGCRLRRHPSPTSDEQAILALLDPQTLPFDPDSVEDHDRSLMSGIKNLFQNLGIGNDRQ